MRHLSRDGAREKLRMWDATQSAQPGIRPEHIRQWLREQQIIGGLR